MVEFRQDHQIEQTVVEQSVWAKRHTASGLPPVADREGDEGAFPRKAFRTKPAAVPHVTRALDFRECVRVSLRHTKSCHDEVTSAMA
jgi:hypothetical protein